MVIIKVICELLFSFFRKSVIKSLLRRQRTFEVFMNSENCALTVSHFSPIYVKCIVFVTVIRFDFSNNAIFIEYEENKKNKIDHFIILEQYINRLIIIAPLLCTQATITIFCYLKRFIFIKFIYCTFSIANDRIIS